MIPGRQAGPVDPTHLGHFTEGRDEYQITQEEFLCFFLLGFLFFFELLRHKDGHLGGGSWVDGLTLASTDDSARPLYNRKAFPWTPQQATPKAPQKAGI